jgi:hypothetical protein
MNNNPIDPLEGPLGATAPNATYPLANQYYPGNFPANSANPDYTGNYPANPIYGGWPSSQFTTPRMQSDGGPANLANFANPNYRFPYTYPVRAWNYGILPRSH